MFEIGKQNAHSLTSSQDRSAWRSDVDAIDHTTPMIGRRHRQRHIPPGSASNQARLNGINQTSRQRQGRRLTPRYIQRHTVSQRLVQNDREYRQKQGIVTPADRKMKSEDSTVAADPDKQCRTARRSSCSGANRIRPPARQLTRSTQQRIYDTESPGWHPKSDEHHECGQKRSRRPPASKQLRGECSVSREPPTSSIMRKRDPIDGTYHVKATHARAKADTSRPVASCPATGQQPRVEPAPDVFGGARASAISHEASRENRSPQNRRSPVPLEGDPSAQPATSRAGVPDPETQGGHGSDTATATAALRQPAMITGIGKIRERCVATAPSTPQSGT